MNTKITYLYRDAGNYKVWNSQVLTGEITPEQVKSIQECLDSGLYFVPDNVGLPEERNGEWEDAYDHDWFELQPDAFSLTEDPPTLDMSVTDLVTRFNDRKGHWQREWW